jgi:hypothetical protein
MTAETIEKVNVFVTVLLETLITVEAVLASGMSSMPVLKNAASKSCGG